MNFLEFLTLPARERREELGNFVGGLFENDGSYRRALSQNEIPSNFQNVYGNRAATPSSVQFLQDYGDFLPITGDVAGIADVAQELTSEDPNYPLAAGLGLATAAGAVPVVGDAAGRAISSGARSLFDVANRLEFDPSTVGSNLGNVRIKPKTETREGEEIFQALDNQPTAKEFTKQEYFPPMDAVTDIGSQKPLALRNHESVIRGTGELVDPKKINMDDLEGKTLLAIVGDNTGRHDILSVGGEVLDTPVRSLAGFQYIDVDDPAHGYAGAFDMTKKKLTQAERVIDSGGDPIYASFLMGQQSGDFAKHTSATFGKLVQKYHSRIDPKDYEEINRLIKNISMPMKGGKKLDKAGNVIYTKGGNPSLKTIQGKPFKDFQGIEDPNAIFEYIASLPTGTQRSYFIKGMDRAYFKDLGLPSIADARLAVADSAQLGMDWGTMGYRMFEPDVSRGIIPTTPEMSTTYDSGVGKVGRAMTMLDESRGVPANLMMSNLSEGQRARGTGGGLFMNSADYKVYEGSPKLATQKIEPINVDTVNTFLDIEKTQGRDRAYQFAQKVLSAGKVTNELIKQAKKMNAPTWVVALMVSQQAMQGDE